jgi:Spy/CpxP family protein refolding chaperone
MISTRRKAALLLGLAFVLGVVTGAAATRLAGDHDGPPPRGRRGAWYLEHLSRGLDLSASQRDSVKAVLDRYGPGMEAIMDEMRPRLDSVRGEMRAEIVRHLTDDQKEEFERMRQHQRNRAGGADARR